MTRERWEVKKDGDSWLVTPMSEEQIDRYLAEGYTIECVLEQNESFAGTQGREFA
jgi:hypothetical protein